MLWKNERDICNARNLKRFPKESLGNWVQVNFKLGTCDMSHDMYVYV